ncbi:MAG: histidine phosphatase family protein [Shimia sp.]
MFKTFPTDTIYLLRHAEGTGTGPDDGLSEAGQDAARALVPQLETLGIDGAFTSPFARARQTIAPFAEARGLTVMALPDLREHRLSMQGHAPDDPLLRDRFTNRRAARPGGESFDAAAARLRQAIRQIARRPLRAPIMATHGGLIASVLSQIDRTYGADDWAAMPRPALYRVTHKNGAPTVIAPVDFAT